MTPRNPLELGENRGRKPHSMAKSIKLDAINRRILKTLHRNANLSNVELAKEVGLSESACYLRRKALDEAGYIVGYFAEIDVDRACHNVQAYVEVTLAENGFKARQKYERLVRKIPEFMDCLRVSGDVDYISLACCASMEALNELCDTLSLSDKNIKHVTTRVILDRPKWITGYPFEKLAWKN